MSLLKHVKVVRQSRNQAGWVVTYSDVALVQRHILIQQVLLNDRVVRLKTLDTPTLLDERLLPAATSLSQVRLAGPDVSSMTFKWDDIRGKIRVVSAQHTSRGLTVSGSEMENVLPTGSIIVGVEWRGGDQVVGSYPHSNTENIADIEEVKQAFQEELAKLKRKRKTQRQVREEAGLNEAELDKLEMWRAASVMSLSKLLELVLGLDDDSEQLEWVIKVSKQTALYAAGVRIGDTVVSVNNIAITQSPIGPLQLSANVERSDLGVSLTVERFKSNRAGLAMEQAKEARLKCLMMNLICLGVWSKPDAEDIEDNLKVTTAFPVNAFGAATRARQQVENSWQVYDSGTTGAGVRSIKKAYATALLSLLLLDATLAQAVLPEGFLSYTPLEDVRGKYGGLSESQLRYAHQVLLAVLNIAMSKQSKDAEGVLSRVRLLPLRFFEGRTAKTPLYHRLMNKLLSTLSHYDTNLEVSLQRHFLTTEHKCDVVFKADVFGPKGMVTLGYLQEKHAKVVVEMLRVGEEALPNALVQSEHDQMLRILQKGFGGENPAHTLVHHMLSRNKVKWTTPLYSCVLKLLRMDNEVAGDHLHKWMTVLKPSLTVKTNDLLWYKRQTVDGAQTMTRVVYNDKNPTAPATLRPLSVRVVPERHVRAILNRVYSRGPACSSKKGGFNCNGTPDSVPVSAKEQEAGHSNTGSTGMVGIGINKMEAYVRSMYWGISRKHISAYLRNKEERQLRAPPLRKTGTVKGALDIGQAVRVAMTAGVTFSRHEAPEKVRDRQREYNKAASAYLKEGRSALSTRYSSRIYKVVTRQEPASDEAWRHEGKVCRYWQGDSSFFGKKQNFNWWPTYNKVPGTTRRKKAQGSGYAPVCFGYVAFIDVYSKYLWLEPLLGEKKPVEGKRSWTVSGGSRKQEAIACYDKATKWCKSEYQRTHGEGLAATKGGLSLVGGGRDGFPWANRHTQTDNGTEFALASSKRQLEDGQVRRYFDLPTMVNSQFADMLNDFQMAIYAAGGKSHSTSEPTISFRQQRDIETAHRSIKNNMYDVVHANPAVYNVRELAADPDKQVAVLKRACDLYNNSPHRSFPVSGNNQQLTPAAVMRYMLHNDGAELNSAEAAAADRLRDEIKAHRRMLSNRRGGAEADKAKYTVAPLQQNDYLAAGQKVPDRFAFPNEYVHPPTTSFGRHELLKVDLGAMEQMPTKGQQNILQSARDRKSERLAPQKGKSRRIAQRKDADDMLEEKEQEDLDYDETGGLYQPEDVLQSDEEALEVVGQNEPPEESVLEEALAIVKNLVSASKAGGSPVKAGPNDTQSKPTHKPKQNTSKKARKKKSADKPVPVLKRRLRRRKNKK